MPDDVVVVGASAGGVEALRAMASGLPKDLPAPVVVVLHIPPGAPSALPAILTRAGPLPARSAAHRLPLHNGTVYVAPADRHVLIADDHLHLSEGPTENGHRPAIDPLFRAAAASFGARAIGIVLSGTGDDGSAGLVALARQGGVALVQEPADALYSQMPLNALEHVPQAKASAAIRLGSRLAQLLSSPGRGSVERPAGAQLLIGETQIAATSAELTSTTALAGAEPSPLSCPSCDGLLFRLPGRPAQGFRCRVGHAWSPASLSAHRTSNAEDALRVALRALEEKAMTLRWLADQETRRGHPVVAGMHTARAVAADSEAAQVRQLIPKTGPVTPETFPADAQP